MGHNKMPDRTVSVTWQWLAGIVISILILGGSAWMTSMYAEVGKVKDEQKQDRAVTQDIKTKIGIIEERVRGTQENVQEIKESQKEQGRKLDELLRRR